MDSRLVALKLFLAELGVPSDIGTLDDRKRVQKAVYLGQVTGVDLGYRFGWYLLGPYSTALTKDYYALAEGVAAGEDDYRGKALHPSLRKRLASVVPIMDVPQEVRLSQEDWLELLASYHYLRFVRRLSSSKAVDQLHQEKPRLAPYASTAAVRLVQAGLLSEV